MSKALVNYKHLLQLFLCKHHHYGGLQTREKSNTARKDQKKKHSPKKGNMKGPNSQLPKKAHGQLWVDYILCSEQASYQL